MSYLRERVGQELVWRKAHGKHRTYALQAGEEIAATLEWQKAAGTLALARVGDDQWTFKRSGFWHPHVTVRPAGSEANLATFERSLNGGTLTLPGGRTLRWGSTNFWHSEWAWQDANKRPLIHFKQHTGLLKYEGHVEIAFDARAIPDLDMVVALGWYLLVLAAQESTAAAVTVAVT